MIQTSIRCTTLSLLTFLHVPSPPIESKGYNQHGHCCFNAPDYFVTLKDPHSSVYPEERKVNQQYHAKGDNQPISSNLEIPL
jgi:hypothetical protein